MISWNSPFTEDEVIRDIEKVMGETASKLCFVQDLTVVSIDDNQYRLSSKLVETLVGLVRVRNPKKAFGPVSTGAVSLVTGITLASRLSSRGETNLQTIQILLQA